jgi:hypothetical protein
VTSRTNLQRALTVLREAAPPGWRSAAAGSFSSVDASDDDGG